MSLRVALGGKLIVKLASPSTGAPPLDQLPALLQLPFTAPLQVCEPADSELAAINKMRVTAKPMRPNARTAYRSDRLFFMRAFVARVNCRAICDLSRTSTTKVV